jgi:hypothetical protein
MNHNTLAVSRPVRILKLISVFVLTFSILLCVFLMSRLFACSTSNVILNVSDLQVVTILFALAISITSQNPKNFQGGLKAGVITWLVSIGLLAGKCDADALKGSLMFFVVAPVLTGSIVGLAQYEKESKNSGLYKLCTSTCNELAQATHS